MKTKNPVILLILIGIVMVLGCQRGPKRAANDRLETAAGESSNNTDPQDTKSSAATGLGHVEHESINGHPFRFEPADFAGTWLGYSHNDVIRVFIMDRSGESRVRLQVDSIAVFGADGAVFTLDPVDVDAKGTADSFSLENRDLAIAMNRGAKLVMEIGEKTYQADVPGIRK